MLSLKTNDDRHNLDLRHQDLALQKTDFQSIKRTGDGLVIGALNKGGTGPMTGKCQEIETVLTINKLDILGICESEIKKGDSVKKWK